MTDFLLKSHLAFFGRRTAILGRQAATDSERQKAGQKNLFHNTVLPFTFRNTACLRPKRLREMIDSKAPEPHFRLLLLRAALGCCVLSSGESSLGRRWRLL